MQEAFEYHDFTHYIKSLNSMSISCSMLCMINRFTSGAASDPPSYRRFLLNFATPLTAYQVWNNWSLKSKNSKLLHETLEALERTR